MLLIGSVRSDSLTPCLLLNQMDGRGSIKELFPTGKQLEPLVAPLADGKVAVGQDDLTVVLNEEGVCTQKCALNWTDIPIAMGKKKAQQIILWQHVHIQYFCDSALRYIVGSSHNQLRHWMVSCSCFYISAYMQNKLHAQSILLSVLVTITCVW